VYFIGAVAVAVAVCLLFCFVSTVGVVTPTAGTTHERPAGHHKTIGLSVS
jgi:hypothetical protein